VTKIEWCAMPGYTPETWNPCTGCSPISEGCEHCYAKRLIGRNLHGYDFTPRYHEDRLSIPKHWKAPRFIFVCSMGDLFHEAIPLDFVSHVLAVAALHPRHIFVLLTKRAERMWEFFSLPNIPDDITEICMRWLNDENFADIEWPLPNIWLGVTAENQKRADERIPILLRIPAAVRFVSVEPMLDSMEMQRHLRSGLESWCEGHPDSPQPNWPGGFSRELRGLDWVICGAETGPGKRRMELNWARTLRDDCKAADVPFFFKKNSEGSRLLDGREWNEYPQLKGSKT